MQFVLPIEVVLGAGLEPARSQKGQGILSPSCLPIPPPERRRHGLHWARPSDIATFRHASSHSHGGFRFAELPHVREKFTKEQNGGAIRNRTGVQGFAGLCVTTPPWRLVVADDEYFASLKQGFTYSVYSSSPLGTPERGALPKNAQSLLFFDCFVY